MLSPQLLLQLNWLPSSFSSTQSSQAQSLAQYPFDMVANRPMTLAVIDLRSQGDVSADEARIITDRVRAELFRSGRYHIIERAEMQAILREQGFQQTQINCEGTDCSVELGKILAVRQLVTGSVSQIGEIYSLSLRVIDVEQGTIHKEAYRDCRCPLEEVLTRLTAELAFELSQDSGAAQSPESDPRRLSALPRTERQAYYDSHSKSPWIASALNGFLPLPFGYGYVDDWGMFWTMALLEAGVVGSAVAFQLSAPRSPLANQAFGVGMLVYVGLALFTVIDVWFRADGGNQRLRQQLRLEQAVSSGVDLARYQAPLLQAVPLYQFSF
ncbi:MAG: hypothetical protein CVV27_03935 [Candidatus Melainabacteria bacterium HGW-Melainabacteria-1]|nr:MAG: hypothetical protein CVV27_03935 [Candidatus Melainabacteria bacterium HGW-Melainabacteria-1]